MNARLTITPQLFTALIDGLTERGQGHRESGAFLLTRSDHSQDDLPQPVTEIAFYDDLDPTCLTGRIDFHSAGYVALQQLCRRDGLRVVADIHTHPAQRVQQSRIDADHPMVALDGHVALIAPNFAAGVTDVSQLGVHLRAGGAWTSYDADRAAGLVLVPQPIPAVEPGPWWRWLRSWLTFRHSSQETR